MQCITEIIYQLQALGDCPLHEVRSWFAALPIMLIQNLMTTLMTIGSAKLPLDNHRLGHNT